jgi:hypothetical protein
VGNNIHLYIFFFAAAPTQTGNVTLLENSRSAIVVSWALPQDDGGATNIFWVLFGPIGTNLTNTTQVTTNKYQSLII